MYIMIIYTRKDNTVIAKFSENWVYSISNLFAKHGISERKFIEEYLSRRTNFTGKATCHVEDTFDLHYGRELAKKRLVANYRKTIQTLAFLLQKQLVKAHEIRLRGLSTLQN